MAMWQEPVRGALPERSFYALPGIDRARLYARDRAPRTPVHHLTGIKVTQVVNGSGVITVPASPWFAHPNGDFDVAFPAEAAIELAALTVAPPGTHLVARTLHYAQLRPCSPESGLFMGRGTVVHTTRSLVFAEARVEDGQGRLIAHATGHVALVPIEPPPDPPAQPPAAEHPTYPTPDPYLRPIPAETSRLFEHFATHGWLGTWELMAAHDLPDAPLNQLLGITGHAVEEGTVTVVMPASGWLQGIDPHVLPGLLVTYAFDSCGGAGLSLLEPGLDVAILAAAVRFLRPVPADGRAVRGAATAVRHDDDTMAIDCRIEDDAGVVAETSVTGLVIPIKSQARRIKPEPVLTTVMFTDIVGSTDEAGRLGDAQWARVLDDHRTIVREQFRRFGGREVNTTGDGFVATFDSPTRALECARAVRDDVRRVGIEIRAGIHTGECEVMGGDITGTAVNVAARIEACAGPGEVWFSSTVRDLVAGAGFTIEDRGAHALKGIPGDLWLSSLKDAG